jgi:hypothetical protein
MVSLTPHLLTILLSLTITTTSALPASSPASALEKRCTTSGPYTTLAACQGNCPAKSANLMKGICNEVGSGYYCMKCPAG